MQFENIGDQRKWDELGRGERDALNRMSRGEATSNDIRAVQNLVARYHGLMSATLQQVVSTINDAAETRIRSILEDRERKGKTDLSEDDFYALMQLAIEKEWQTSSAELAVLIEDELRKANNKQTEDIDSLLIRRLASLVPEKRDDSNEVPDLDTEPPPAEARPNSPGAVAERMADDPQEIPLSDKLIQQANDSYQLTDDLKDALDELSNPKERDKREDKRIKKWWRAFKGNDAFRFLGRQASSFGSQTAVLLGRLLLNEIAGGKIWETISGYFKGEEFGKLIDGLWDQGLELLDKGWTELKSFFTMDNLKAMLKQAFTLGSGLNAIGLIYSKLSELLFGDEGVDATLAPNSAGAVSRWDEFSQSIAADAGFYKEPVDPEAPTPASNPTVKASGTVDGMSPAEKVATTVPQVPVDPTRKDDPTYRASGQVTDAPADGMVTDGVDTRGLPSGSPLSVDQGSITPSVSGGMTKVEPEPLDPKGAGTSLGQSVVPNTEATPVAQPAPDLGSDNSIPTPPPSVQPPTDNPQFGTAGGGVNASLSSLRRGLSVDGTLAALNLGMFTA